MRKAKKKEQKTKDYTLIYASVSLLIGVLLTVAYFSGGQTGFLGTLSQVLVYALGRCALVLPLLCLLVAAQLFVNGKVNLLSKNTLIVFLVVLCLLGTAHHLLVPLQEELYPNYLPQGAGLVGGVIALVLHRLLGNNLTTIVFVAAWLVIFGLLMPWKKIYSMVTNALSGADDEDVPEEQQSAPTKARNPKAAATTSSASETPFFRRPAQQPSETPRQATKGKSVDDIYNNNEFDAFTDGIKEKSTFRKILDFHNKSVYDEEPVRQQVQDDPIQIPEWEEEDRSNVVLQPRIHYDHLSVVRRPAAQQERRQEEKPAISINTPEPTPVIRNDYHDMLDEEPDKLPDFLQPSPAEVVPEVAAPFEYVQEQEEPAVAKPATVATSVKVAEQQEEPKQEQQITIYDSADKIGAQMQSAQNQPQQDVPAESSYRLPPLELLDAPQHSDPASYEKDIMEQCAVLEQTLADFRVRAKVKAVTRGPSVTRFELEPAPGVKVSSVVNLADDIALRLAAPGVRIEAPIPGKSAIGIEAPNTKNDMVCFREVVDNENVRKAQSRLCIGLGKDISGNIISADLAKMPHLLVAGSTGSGKSVCINTIIAGILYKARPEEVKLILVDPKVVELSNYNGIPHLLTPVVTEPKKAASALHWAVAEMERRYQMFADNNVRNIDTYNTKVEEKMPFIVIIIDELSDLMMVAKVDVEDAILRLAQKARAAGIHLILATQRPSVDVITGIVKANIPSRIAFAVSSQTDSRTIIDMGGAEKLLGKGDMLFYPIGMNKPVRVQGAFVTDAELNDIVDYIVKQSIPVNYTEEVTQQELASDAKNAVPEEANNSTSEEDELFADALALVLDMGQASSSMLQRRFRIGYTRAARLVDTMEELGIVGKSVGSKPREVIMSRQEAEERFLGRE